MVLNPGAFDAVMGSLLRPRWRRDRRRHVARETHSLVMLSKPGGGAPEQIRLALRLLPSVGVFSEIGTDGLTLSANIASVEDGANLVLDDARQGTSTYDRSVTKAESEEALFPD